MTSLAAAPATSGRPIGVYRRAATAAPPRLTPPTLLCAAIALVALAGLALIVAADLADGGAGYESADAAIFAVMFPALPVMGRLLWTRAPQNPIGPMFLVGALAIAASAFAHGYGDFALYAHPGALPGAEYVVWAGWLGWVGFGLLVLGVPLLYPDGRLPGRGWIAVAVLGAVAVTLEALVLALRPGAFADFPEADFPGVTNPFGVAALGDAASRAHDVAAGLFLAAVVLAFASLLARARGADARRRGQLVWLACASGLLLAVDLAGNLVSGGALHDHPALCTWGAGAARGLGGTVLPMLLYVGFPVAVAMAILRHRLYDIDRLVRRSVTYGGLTLAVTLAYVGAGAGVGILAGHELPLGIAILGAIAAALAVRTTRLAVALGRRVEEVEEVAAELAASRARIVEAAAAERRRIERNIHDGAQQELVSLIAKARLARNQLPAEAAEVDAALAALAEDARMTLAGLRELAQGIHPSVLTDRGLVAALEARVDRCPLPVEFDVDRIPTARRYGEDVEGAAYFVACEALTNAVKHSGARTVRLRVRIQEQAESGGRLCLDVEDDGVGFDPSLAAEGRGLANIADRVDAAGGELELETNPGGGVRLGIRLPIPGEHPR